MFWDNVAGIYDIFVNVYNKKTHTQLIEKVTSLISPSDNVLECACGTGMLTVPVAKICKNIIATDFSYKMLLKVNGKCKSMPNVAVQKADITNFDFPDESFDKVIAGNVIHLLDNPLSALQQLNRVCKSNGKIIIPTYMNKKQSGKSNNFSQTLGKAGVDFKRQFSFDTYKQFFENAGYTNGEYILVDGRVPCAIAVLNKKNN